jgi:AraC-like DNA-binding protein
MPNDIVDETVGRQQSELAKLIERHTDADGIHATEIPCLFLSRSSQPSAPMYGVHEPALCIIAQGRKQVLLMGNRFLYGPEQCLVVSVDLPVVGQVIEATSDVPYLGLRLDLKPGQLGELMLEMGMKSADARRDPKPGLSFTPVGPQLLDAAARLLRLLETPRDIPVLAPLVVREMLYRLLSGEQAASLRHIALSDHRQQSVTRAIGWLREHFAEPFRIETVARFANVSPSALHHNFKAVTSMSPLQYQKRLRLQEARRLMLGESLDAAMASHSVGYESPSQFSREYSRLFGAPPSRDIAQLKGGAGTTIDTRRGGV